LMASKLAVAGIIEGNFTDEGLAAMSDCADMTTALARELTQGIQDQVEDLSAVFKKMAKFKSESVPAEENADVLFPDLKVTDDVSPATVSYVPLIERKPPDTEGIREDFLLKLRQLKNVRLEVIKPVQKAGNAKTTSLPPDFDPFAEEAAA